MRATNCQPPAATGPRRPPSPTPTPADAPQPAAADAPPRPDHRHVRRAGALLPLVLLPPAAASHPPPTTSYRLPLNQPPRVLESNLDDLRLLDFRHFGGCRRVGLSPLPTPVSVMLHLPGSEVGGSGRCRSRGVAVSVSGHQRPSRGRLSEQDGRFARIAGIWHRRGAPDFVTLESYAHIRTKLSKISQNSAPPLPAGAIKQLQKPRKTPQNSTMRRGSIWFNMSGGSGRLPAASGSPCPGARVDCHLPPASHGTSAPAQPRAGSASRLERSCIPAGQGDAAHSHAPPLVRAIPPTAKPIMHNRSAKRDSVTSPAAHRIQKWRKSSGSTFDQMSSRYALSVLMLWHKGARRYENRQ
jgi:hypothetical protein